MRSRVALLTALFSVGCATADLAGDRAHDAPHADRAEATRHAEAPSTTLPPVPLLGLDARPTLLAEAAAGKPALVSFWASWCDACLTEIDALNRLDERARASGGVVIGVAVGESREKAAAFARQHGLRYAQLVDEKLALADALGQRRLPATLVLDRSGRVVFTGGILDERALEAFRGAMAR